MPRRRIPPFELRVERLGPKGLGWGRHEGHEVLVRFGPPGALLRVVPHRRKGGVLHARRLALLEPPPDAVAPRCVVFGLCGGCSLQELPLAAQRAAKRARVDALLAPLDGVVHHGLDGVDAAYGYRNKVELSFGVRRYLDDEAQAAGGSHEGRWLGFHAPGRFDRVVDARRCELVPEGLNALIALAREALAASALPPFDVKTHEGFWRHLVLREAGTGQRLAAIYTSPPPEGGVAEAELEALAARMQAAGVEGVVWFVNDRPADAAIGALRAVLAGQPFIEERLGPVRYRLSPTAFFQTNTRGAERLYAHVAALAGGGPRLLDLYCGTGAIGLYLAGAFDEVLGVELNAEAVADARANAALSGVTRARYVNEAVEHALPATSPLDVAVVDPPRAGLHPRAARWLAEQRLARLVYVACQPESLARDRAILEAGGWRMAELVLVDLFPQTGHVEAVALFLPA